VGGKSFFKEREKKNKSRTGPGIEGYKNYFAKVANCETKPPLGDKWQKKRAVFAPDRGGKG